MKNLGLVGYEINVDGCTRQALIDHLKPRPATESQREELMLINGAPGYDADDPIPLVVVDEEESEEVMDTIPSTNSSLCPQFIFYRGGVL